MKFPKKSFVSYWKWTSLNTFTLSLVSIGLFFPVSVFARVYISEIMYDAAGADDGHEWVEIYNGSDAPINFFHWKFFEANTNHALTPSSTSVGTTSPGQFIIIASNVSLFLKDYPAFSGTLFDSTFSLGNKGETIALKNDKGEIIDSVSYLPQGKSGQSLQLINAKWLASAPTPGIENKFVAEIIPTPIAPGTPVSPPKTATSKKASVTSLTTKASVKPSSPQPKESAPAPAPDSQTSNNLWVWVGALASVIVATLIGLHFVDQKNTKVEPLHASDFEITEEIEEEV